MPGVMVVRNKRYLYLNLNISLATGKVMVTVAKCKTRKGVSRNKQETKQSQRTSPLPFDNPTRYAGPPESTSKSQNFGFEPRHFVLQAANSAP